MGDVHFGVVDPIIAICGLRKALIKCILPESFPISSFALYKIAINSDNEVLPQKLCT